MLRKASGARVRALTPDPRSAPARPPQGTLRVLVAAHAHPQISNGGAEIAAYELFNSLNRRPGYEAWFLGCVRDEMHQKLGATFNQPYSKREYLYAGGAFDWFLFANRDPKFPREFRKLLGELKPQIVHFHHYVNFGVEALWHVREVLPECRIVVTLHEYLALCHHYGQMITRPNRTLCHAATPVRCAACFPDYSPSDFFLRQRYIRRFFDLVDGFIAPSRFLAERYIAWGLPEERVAVVENLTPESPAEPPALKAREGKSLRVGFFGQISLLKGINVLFDSAALLAERKNDHISFEIHGDYAGQPPEFQEDFLRRLAQAGRNVKFQGAYEQARVNRLMRSVDLILVPSIWWENSPVVIQEALHNRRPVICSDIGGMAEKIRDGVDGFHFPVGNALALTALLLKLADQFTKVTEVAKTMRRPAGSDESCARYLEFYGALVNR